MSANFIPSFQDPNSRYAYVWYVTSYPYLCSALTALRLLKKARAMDNIPFPFPVDYVVTYVPEDMESSRPAQDLLSDWIKEGGTLRNFTALRDGVKDTYYKYGNIRMRSYILQFVLPSLINLCQKSEHF